MLMQKNLTRRKFLLGALLALPTAQLLRSGLTAAQAADMAAPDLAAYRPAFFSADEWRFILAATDHLIPAGGKGKAPGALETNVPIFIDQQLHDERFGKEIYMQPPFFPQAPATFGYQLPFYPQQLYQTGIRLSEQWSRQKWGKPFAQLEADQQRELLTGLQKNQLDFTALGEQRLRPADFFSQLWADTKNGYLSDPMYGGNKGMKAWIAIGFPGARASFLEWIKQHDVPYPLGPVSIQGLRA